MLFASPSNGQKDSHLKEQTNGYVEQSKLSKYSQEKGRNSE